MKFKKYASVIILSAIILSSCVSSTVIQSNVSNATVYIDGEHAGTTPVTMKNTKVVSSCTDIRLEKEGYETLTTQICRDEEIDIAPAVAGFCLTVPWLWVYKYNPSHYYELKKKENIIAPINNETIIEASSSEEQKTKIGKLKELKDLFDQGLINEDEYKKAKADILKIK
jgi:hypothetical protein